MMGYGYGPFGWVGFIVMIFFWVIFAVAIAFLIRWLIGLSGISKSEKHNSAIEILKDRYAKGEIDKKEFEEKKKDLL